MSKRRSRGDGGLHWDEKRQRWIASVTTGYTPAGKRIVRRGSGKTKTEAKNKLKEVLRDHEDGVAIASNNYTVAAAVTDWLTYGLNGQSQATIIKYTIVATTHVIPSMGARKLRDLSAEDVDRWLADKAKTLSTRTLRELHAILNRSVNRAMARDKVKRNVVPLCTVPKGRPGRPSKSLTLNQAKALLHAAEDDRLYAYVVLSLLTGARTEELRALTWDHVDLAVDPTTSHPYRHRSWCGVRSGPVTIPRPRSPGAPSHSPCAASRHYAVIANYKIRTGKRPVRPGKIIDWCSLPRSVPSWTRTEKVYRHQLRPVLLNGAIAMDSIFGSIDDDQAT